MDLLFMGGACVFAILVFVCFVALSFMIGMMIVMPLEVRENGKIQNSDTCVIALISIFAVLLYGLSPVYGAIIRWGFDSTKAMIGG